VCCFACHLFETEKIKYIGFKFSKLIRNDKFFILYLTSFDSGGCIEILIIYLLNCGKPVIPGYIDK
jgi:hypothetical protein